VGGVIILISNFFAIVFFTLFFGGIDGIDDFKMTKIEKIHGDRIRIHIMANCAVIDKVKIDHFLILPKFYSKKSNKLLHGDYRIKFLIENKELELDPETFNKKIELNTNKNYCYFFVDFYEKGDFHSLDSDDYNYDLSNTEEVINFKIASVPYLFPFPYWVDLGSFTTKTLKIFPQAIMKFR
jgi:hypothetical protein